MSWCPVRLLTTYSSSCELSDQPYILLICAQRLRKTLVSFANSRTIQTNPVIEYVLRHCAISPAQQLRPMWNLARAFCEARQGNMRYLCLIVLYTMSYLTTFRSFKVTTKLFIKVTTSLLYECAQLGAPFRNTLDRRAVRPYSRCHKHHFTLDNVQHGGIFRIQLHPSTLAPIEKLY